VPSPTSIACFAAQHLGSPPQLRPEEILADITRFGLSDPIDAGVALELGVSLWFQQSGARMDAVRSTLVELRNGLLDVAGLDAATEPVPLRGRSERSDLLQLTHAVCQLVRRAAGRTGWEPEELAAAISRRSRRGPGVGAHRHSV
jgi:hypothetical protein